MKKFFKPLIFTILLAISSVCFRGNILVADAVGSAEPVVVSATPSATDSSYDLRDYIDIQVENQGSYGICWAYASLTSLETYLALNYGEYYDFSELHLAVSAYKQDGYYSSLYSALKSGGNFENLFTYAQKAKNLVLEEEYSISNYSSISSKMVDDYESINSNYYSIAKINDTNRFASYYGDKSNKNLTAFRQSVKSHILNYGSVTTAIKVEDAQWTSSYDLCVQDSSIVLNPPSSVAQSVDHLVSIIGWDDNYDSNGEWSEKGAYLCLNSWGSSWGTNDGCFYVSYNDYLVEFCMQGITSASLLNDSPQFNLYDNHQSNTFTQQHTFSGPLLYTAQILDVSQYLNKAVQSIDIFVKGDSSSFYIKFFDTYSSAFNNLSSILSSNSRGFSLQGEYGLYNRFKPSNTLTISNNYMAIISCIQNPTDSFSIASKTDELEQTCYVVDNGSFSLTWNSFLSSDGTSNNYTLPIRIQFAGDATTISNFSGDSYSTIDHSFSSGTKQYIKNNAIFLNKTISCTIGDTSIDVDEIKINKLYKDGHTDVTSDFSIDFNNHTLSITLSQKNNVTAGNYIITIPASCGNIYRVIEVQNIATYLINYHLDGGEASNPKYFTNEQTSLILENPTKAGYVFVGWYTDSKFTNEFINTNLPKSSLDLYAKYDFAVPTLLSKSDDIDCIYSKNSFITLQVKAEHALENSFNTISYQWYKKELNGTSFNKLIGKTNSSLTISSVADSGYYACEISITIGDPSLVTEECTRTLTISETSAISVKIDKYIYDMSNAKWNYTEALYYKEDAYTVEIVGLPEGVTINYTGNTATQIGKYTAIAKLEYDDMDGNAYAEPIKNLDWEIRKAKIIITITNIVEEKVLSSSEIKSKFDCTIEAEYLPKNLTTKEQKLAYLGFEYIGPIDTTQPTIKTISGSTLEFNVYDITIIDGQYRGVARTLLDSNNSGISVYNADGFTRDCTFEVEYVTELSVDAEKLLSKAHLNLVKGYHLKFSYLREEDKYIVTLPIERNDLLAKLHIYMIKDGKLVRVNQTDISTSGLTIEASELDTQFLIVEADTGHTSNTQKMAIILIACGFVILYVCIIVEYIRKKRKLFI